LGHDENYQKAYWNDFIRLGLISDAQIKQNGVTSFYRIKRITKDTFRDLKFYAHFFNSNPELRVRIKSSNKYDFNPKLYHFTTYNYHKSGENLRYHFNQGIGIFLNDNIDGNFTSELGWAYDKSDFIESDEKTTYLKSALSFDQNYSKLKTKLELEYYHQISELIVLDLSRFETIIEFQYLYNDNWSIVFNIDREIYTVNNNQFRLDPITLSVSLNRNGVFN
jgi:hypothetical protein